jgi:hypothetical protein
MKRQGELIIEDGELIIKKLMLRSQRLMIALDAFFVPEAQRTLAGGGAIAQPPET